MPDLIAQGPKPEQRWRRKLQAGVKQVLGRAAGPWSTPWDERISRRHVEIVYRDGRLFVEAVEGASNPVFYRGYKTDQFHLRPGEHFAIGQTTFTLVEERVHVSLDLPQPAEQKTFPAVELRGQPFRQADKRIDALSRLPEIIRGSASDQELFVRLVNLLLGGVERATAAAVVAVRGQGSAFRAEGSEFSVQDSGAEFDVDGREPEASSHDSGDDSLPPPHALSSPLPPVEILHWDRRILGGDGFRPSERLIRQALASGESVAFVWTANQPRSRDFTLSEGIDWAFCTPVPGKSGEGWALYVTGGFTGELAIAHEPDAELLRDDVKFAELTATTLSSLREARQLASRQASLSQFFSPVVLEALAAQEADEALAPREADVTVLFCDLRGFTATSERAAGNLFDLLERVSRALGVMTRHILEEGGVVGDFHGDAAMGFWGWPLPQADAVERACRAALAIRGAFVGSNVGPSSRDYPEQQTAPPSSITPSGQSTFSPPLPVTHGVPFRVGIGIASGRAVAGKIGTQDQVKVTVFGPVVNLASRLETMTKRLRASILIDPPTAAVIRTTVPPSVCRVRRLAKVRPAGLSAPLEVSELLPPWLGRSASGIVAEPLGELSDEHIASYEAALDAFQNRDWPLALKLLHEVPPDDVAKDFLTIFIAQHGRTPPDNWDGAIPLDGK
jgi:adenylate cyclase